MKSVVPPSEAWLFRDSRAMASVLKGLREAAAGKTHFLGSFAGQRKKSSTGRAATIAAHRARLDFIAKCPAAPRPLVRDNVRRSPQGAS